MSTTYKPHVNSKNNPYVITKVRLPYRHWARHLRGEAFCTTPKDRSGVIGNSNAG